MTDIRIQIKTRLGQSLLVAVFTLMGMAAVSCGPVVGRDPSQQVPGGDPQRGQQLLSEYGCNSCHTIPGVREADAAVGPPLNEWADRHYIAGLLPNTPENLIAWIRSPQSFEPGTVMPDLGVTEEDAGDIAAYLYTLQQRSRLQFPTIGGN